MSKLEADIWNFLIFWCHGHNAAHLDVIHNWLPAYAGEDVNRGLERMLKQDIVKITRFGFLPIVDGRAYSNAKKNKRWSEFPIALLVTEPPRVTH